ncbi:type VII secretion target [Mycobacterium sp. M23085]|uniref:type VII secretion target n=1 Tax=Mycobacterium sp. M23085 TaxID=3378087 RepID=UPI00387811B9
MKFVGGTCQAAVDRTQIDVPAAQRVANQFAMAADFIDRAVSAHLSRLAFGGAGAGREHTARGDMLRAELERLVAQMSQWSRASGEIAAALRSSAERYADAEFYAAARIA